MYKFRIINLLYALPLEEYFQALNILPELLEISPATFKRWLKTPRESYFDIPFQKVILLAQYFNVKPQEIYTDYEQAIKNYTGQ